MAVKVKKKTKVPKAQQINGQLSVVSTVLNQSKEVIDEDKTHEMINVRPFATDPAYVKVGFGATLNLGNYESGRVDVEVTMPCYKEEVTNMYHQVKAFAGQKCDEEIRRIKSHNGVA